MTLEELLMKTNSRISLGDKWLYGEGRISEWVVLRRPYRAKKNIELYRGQDLSFAINRLSEGELDES